MPLDRFFAGSARSYRAFGLSLTSDAVACRWTQVEAGLVFVGPDGFAGGWAREKVMRRFRRLIRAVSLLLAFSAADSVQATDVSIANYRWSLERGPFDVALRLDARPLAIRPLEAHVDSVVSLGATVPSFSVGLRSNSTRADGAASSLLERALGAGEGAAHERKVGIEWKAAPSRVFLHQGLGIRLDGDDRLTMRLRKGSLGLYMQSNF
jgi:hypothetical protein